MRGLEQALVVERPIEAAWAGLSRLDCWEAFSEAFAGRSFIYAVDNGAQLGHGAELPVAPPKGRQVLRWRISSWTPPEGFELVTLDGAKGLSGYHMLLSFKLSRLDEERTEVAAKCVILFTSNVIELLSLIFPLRWLYVRRME